MGDVPNCAALVDGGQEERGCAVDQEYSRIGRGILLVCELKAL